MQATTEILKLFHKDKDEAHEYISLYFPNLVTQVDQSACQDVWCDISKVYKELIMHQNKVIAARAMENCECYLRYGLASKLLDEGSCTAVLEWLAKQSKLFYVHLYKVDSSSDWKASPRV